jgi:hypothetical protein
LSIFLDIAADILSMDRPFHVAAIVNTTRQFSEYMMEVVNHEPISDIHQKPTARISVSRVFAVSVRLGPHR